MKRIFLILLLVLNINSIKAYENDYFSIELPEGYKESIIENNTYKWIKDDNYISITVANNTNEYNVSKYSEKDISNQKNYIEESTNNQLSKYNIKVNVDYIDKVKGKNEYYLKYKTYWPTLDIIGYDTYQIGSVYTTDKYIFTMIYSSNQEINEYNEYNSLVDSFIIKDKTNSSSYKNTIILIICLIACLGSIAKIIYDLKKRN